jgi:hypothetical protein
MADDNTRTPNRTASWAVGIDEDHDQVALQTGEVRNDMSPETAYEIADQLVAAADEVLAERANETARAIADGGEKQ